MRADRGELLSAGCAVALLVCTFGLAWYGGDGIPGSTPSTRLVWTESAWQALTIVRWAILVTVFVAVGSVFLHLSQHSHGSRTNTGALVAMLGAATTVLLIIRVLIDMPAGNRVVDQKLGAVLGTVLAIGIAAGGARSFRDERLSPAGRRRRSLISDRGQV